MLDFITINTHSSIRIDEGQIIYVDPFKIADEKHDADIILITHDHFDHLSHDDIRRVMKEDTVIVCPTSVDAPEEMGLTVVKAGTDEKLTVKGIEIETVRAYNIQKAFHPKKNGWLGYIINSAGHGRIYIAGDTDITAEAKQVKCDIALIPVGGTYTMDAKKAAEFVNKIRPSVVIPVHYGTFVGSPKDGEEFAKHVDDNIKVEFKIEF